MNRPVPFAVALLALSTALPVQSQTPRQERIKSCHQQSNDLKLEGSKWKEFMKACVDAKEPSVGKARSDAASSSVSLPPP